MYFEHGEKEISYLKQICIPRMEVRYMQTKKDILEFELVLESNEMAFVQILWQRFQKKYNYAIMKKEAKIDKKVFDFCFFCVG